MRTRTKLVTMAVVVAAAALPLSADVIWPSVLLEGRLRTWWSILIGLVIEGFVLYRFLRLRLTSAAVADIVMSAVSTGIGFFLIPMAGYAYEAGIGQHLYRFNIFTFSPLTWCVTCLGAALLNTTIEATVLRIGWKVPYSRRNLGWLAVANVLSVAIALVSLMMTPPRI